MKPRLVYPAFAFVCLVFGTTFLAIRIGVSGGASPFLFAGLRFSGAGLLLALILLGLRRTSLAALRALWPRAALVSVFYVVGNFGTSFWAMRHIASGTAAQFQASVPVWTSVLAVLLLGKRLRPLHLLGLSAGLAGVLLIAQGPSSAADPLAPLAALVMVAGSLSFALGTVLYRRLFGQAEDPFAVNALNMLTGGLLLLGLSALFEEPRFPLAAATLGPLLYLALVGSILGHSSNLYVVKQAGPVFASAWFFVSPPIATLVGALALGEAVLPSALLGTLASLLGVASMGLADRGNSG